MTTPADRVSRIFHAAIARPPEERFSFVAEVCGGDDALKQEIESLLALDGATPGFLERPAAEALAGDQTAARLVGQTWGAYTIVAPLGIGGMGEVYRAHDAKLNRDVALKVLRSDFSADPERRARLAREARLLAALNHPHIGGIYGLEERDDAVALVLELVEGPTLADRLEHGPLPVRESQAIAHQIAEALQAAHDKGFVHRDLKPANIVLQPSADGAPHAKVLDFGLAKPLADDARSQAALTDTTEGRILGTPAYMSPEQARGLPVDRRTDIWAFGCVLFEMLSGVQPFEGATATDTLARILDREPDWSVLARSTPDSVRRLLERCLRKEPRRRLHDIGDALIELEDSGDGSSRRGVLWKAAGLALGFAAVAGVLVAAAFLSRSSPSAGQSIEFEVPAPKDSLFFGNSRQFAISPDGRQAAIAVISNSVQRIWIRPVSSAEARPIAGTDDGYNPFWRPDGRTVGFFANGRLRTIPLEGGTPVVLADSADSSSSGAWNDHDDILFTRRNALWHVRGTPSAEPARQVTTPSPGEVHVWPSFLPDGEHFVYLVKRDTSNEARIGSLTSPQTRSLGTFESHVAFADGHLFYVRSGNLVARRFDSVAQRFDGEPLLLDMPVAVDPLLRQGMFSVSPSTLAYSRVAIPPKALTWVDRQGTVIGTAGPPGALSNPNLSFDDQRIAVALVTETQGSPLLESHPNTDIWLLDRTGGSGQRLTQDRAWEWDPAWSPDGQSIAFTSEGRLFVRPSNGTGEPVLLDGVGTCLAPDWSPNGRHLIYAKLDMTSTAYDLWTIDLAGDRRPRPYLKTPFIETRPAFSPDGEWVAYHSNVTGVAEIYVRRFPQGQDAIRVSFGKGTAPRWVGREILFLSLTSMMAADVDTRHGPTVGTPRELFPVTFLKRGDGHPFAVTRNGQRFLLPIVQSTPLTVVSNWKARLHR